MSLPTFNVVGGAVAAIALGAILYFGASAACGPTPAPAAPAPVTLDNPEPEAPVSKPVRVVPRRPMPDVNKVCTVAHPCHTVVKKNGVYHKVLKGGRVDGKAKCSWVPQVAHEYPKETVLAAAKSYGISEKKLAALSLCLN